MIRGEQTVDIWSLHRQGLSNRAIARRLGLDRRTVSKYIRNREMPSYRKVNRGSRLDEHKKLIDDWLSQDSYTARWIHDRLVLQGFEGSYETVKRYVRQVRKELARKAYQRFETDPGNQAQVDFADFKVIEADGSEITLYVFLMILGYSRASYVEFVSRCTMKHFLECHQRAFGYLGGVPGEILYDNMKNVVIRRHGKAVEWNPRFLEFACHYGFKPVACPPYAPWSKGKVERPIHYIRENFWRGYRFSTLEQANKDLLRWLDNVANCRQLNRFHQTVKERWECERSLLGEIPQRRFDTSDVYYRKVYKDCTIHFQCNTYAVPHRYVGQRVKLKVNDGVLRIHYDDELLVVYSLPAGKGHFVRDERIYQALREDQEQLRRKYGSRRPRGKRKGKATRGLVKGTLAAGELRRDPAEYDWLVGVA